MHARLTLAATLAVLAFGVPARAENAQGLLDRAIRETKQGDRSGALGDLDAAIAQRPDFAEAYLARAEARYMPSPAGRDLDGAMADYSKALDLLRDKAEQVYLSRGMMRASKGDFESAVGDFTACLKIDPSNAEAYRRRAYVEQDMGDLEAAIDDYTKLLAADPTAVSAYYYRAFALQLRGSLEGALEDYQRYLGAAGASAQARARFELAMILRRLGKDERPAGVAALPSSDLAPADAPVAQFILRRASEADLLAAVGLGNAPAAKDWDGTSVRRAQAQAYYFAGMARIAAGDPAGAREMLTRCVDMAEKYSLDSLAAKAELARTQPQDR